MIGELTEAKPKWLDVDTMKTFKNGIYTSGYLKGNEIFYRAGDIDKIFKSQHVGRFSRAMHQYSIEKVRNDKAIPEYWKGNDGAPYPATITHGFSFSSDSGTSVYGGKVAPQTGYYGDFRTGGTNQLFIPNAAEAGHEISSWPLIP